MKQTHCGSGGEISQQPHGDGGKNMKQTQRCDGSDNRQQTHCGPGGGSAARVVKSSVLQTDTPNTCDVGRHAQSAALGGGREGEPGEGKRKEVSYT